MIQTWLSQSVFMVTSEFTHHTEAWAVGVGRGPVHSKLAFKPDSSVVNFKKRSPTAAPFSHIMRLQKCLLTGGFLHWLGEKRFVVNLSNIPKNTMPACSREMARLSLNIFSAKHCHKGNLKAWFLVWEYHTECQRFHIICKTSLSKKPALKLNCNPACSEEAIFHKRGFSRIDGNRIKEKNKFTRPEDKQLILYCLWGALIQSVWDTFWRHETHTNLNTHTHAHTHNPLTCQSMGERESRHPDVIIWQSFVPLASWERCCAREDDWLWHEKDSQWVWLQGHCSGIIPLGPNRAKNTSFQESSRNIRKGHTVACSH